MNQDRATDMPQSMKTKILLYSQHPEVVAIDKYIIRLLSFGPIGFHLFLDKPVHKKYLMKMIELNISA